jgi:hypothetical protein
MISKHLFIFVFVLLAVPFLSKKVHLRQEKNCPPSAKTVYIRNFGSYLGLGVGSGHIQFGLSPNKEDHRTNSEWCLEELSDSNGIL